jgi:hypothetical protein
MRTLFTEKCGATGESAVRHSFEGAAAGEPESLENQGGGAEAGKGGLKQVEADESGKKPEPGRDEKNQRQRDQDHQPSEGEHRAIEIHKSAPCLSKGSLYSNIRINENDLSLRDRLKMLFAAPAKIVAEAAPA